MSSVEDPEKILDQAVEDMQTDLIKLRQAAAEVTASEKRMQAKYEQAQKTAVSLFICRSMRRGYLMYFSSLGSRSSLLTRHFSISPFVGRVVSSC